MHFKINLKVTLFYALLHISNYSVFTKINYLSMWVIIPSPTLVLVITLIGEELLRLAICHVNFFNFWHPLFGTHPILSLIHI